MPLTREQSRAIDRAALTELGLPGLVLMENAGINATALAIDVLEEGAGVAPNQSRIAVICGGGNNGGDGYVIARQLHNWGAAVTIYACKPIDDLTGDAAVNGLACRAIGLDIRASPTDTSELDRYDLLVDALLGTGFTGEIRSDIAQIIEAINGAGHPYKLAVDTPSGLDCDTGQPSSATVRADVTVTFVDTKTGFNTEGAESYTGMVRVADIGLPDDFVIRVTSR